jgi:hypothetical protein
MFVVNHERVIDGTQDRKNRLIVIEHYRVFIAQDGWQDACLYRSVPFMKTLGQFRSARTARVLPSVTAILSAASFNDLWEYCLPFLEKRTASSLTCGVEKPRKFLFPYSRTSWLTSGYSEFV